MSKMFIANCTQQHQVLNFSLPEERKATSQPLAMGKQDYVGGYSKDLSPIQVEAVVEQLSPYGLKRVTELNRLPNMVIPYIWDDKVIKYDTIKRVLEHNKLVQVGLGEKRRQNAAIGTNDALKHIIEDAVNMGAEVPPAKTFTVEVEEVDNEAHTDGTKQIGQGFRIDNAPGNTPSKKKRRASVGA